MQIGSIVVSEPTKREDAVTKSSGKNIRLILVDDNSLFRDGLANLLAAQQDLEVAATVESPSAAIEQIRRWRPDIVLLGWAASSAGSQKVFNAIQESRLPARIIMLTSEDAKEDFVEA